jgi:hypothetical protein
VRSTAAPYTESRLTHLVRNKCVGFPVVEQYLIFGIRIAQSPRSQSTRQNLKTVHGRKAHYLV